MPNLIAISGKQFAGKDLLADFLLLALPAYRKAPLARAIKLEFAQLYHLTPQEIEANKALYRSGLITLGQRRRLQDKDYWIRKILEIDDPVIVPDMRLKREYEYFRRRDAFCIRVESDREVRATRGTLVQENDPTECDLDDVTNWNIVIQNNGTVEALKQQVEKLAALLGEKVSS